MTEPTPTLWRPSPTALKGLAAVVVIALAIAFYMRYGLVEPSSVGLVCDAGATTMVCLIRRVFIGVFTHSGFGIVALLAAVLALVRPSATLMGAALFTGLLGVVLYNTSLAALALSLLPFVLARRAAPKEFQPE